MRNARWFLALGVVAAATVIWQLALSVEEEGGLIAALVIQFGYFTIWTNILVALTCLWLGATPWRGWTKPRASLAAATTLFIVFVGVIYDLLLAEDHDPQGQSFIVNLLLHYIIPAAMLLLWALGAPKGLLTLRSAFSWCAYPLIYLGFALIRGELIGLYPYFFLDVGTYGYPQVALNAAGLSFVLLGLSILLVGLDRLLGRQRAAG